MSTQQEKLKAIADAIREKDGTSDSIKASDFAVRILAIPTGSAFSVPLIVTADAGAVVTAASGGITVMGISGADNACMLILTAPGEWAIEAELEGVKRGPIAIEVEDKVYRASFSMQSRLPDGYTEVKYIQSDSDSSINTGVKLNFTSGSVVMDIEVLDYVTGTEYIYYATVGSGTSLYSFALCRTSASAMKIGINGGTASQTLDISNNRLNIFYANKNVSIEDTVLATNTRTGSTNTFYLFRYSSSTKSVQSKLYSCKIYSGTTLTRDFVPCIDPTGAVGLYDLVTEAFFANAGTGAFTAGPAV